MKTIGNPSLDKFLSNYFLLTLKNKLYLSDIFREIREDLPCCYLHIFIVAFKNIYRTLEPNQSHQVFVSPGLLLLRGGGWTDDLSRWKRPGVVPYGSKLFTAPELQ